MYVRSRLTAGNDSNNPPRLLNTPKYTRYTRPKFDPPLSLFLVLVKFKEIGIDAERRYTPFQPRRGIYNGNSRHSSSYSFLITVELELDLELEFRNWDRKGKWRGLSEYESLFTY